MPLNRALPGKATLFAVSLPLGLTLSRVTLDRSRRYKLKSVGFNKERWFCISMGDKVGWVGWMSSREVQINVAAEGYQVKKAFISVTTPLGLKYSCCDAACIFCKCFYFFLSL